MDWKCSRELCLTMAAFLDGVVSYQGCEETVTCDDATCLHLPSCPECPIQHYKMQICQAVRYISLCVSLCLSVGLPILFVGLSVCLSVCVPVDLS